MVINADPVENGNIVIVDGKAHVLGKRDLFDAIVPTGEKYLDHHVTCPHAAQWRGQTKKNKASK